MAQKFSTRVTGLWSSLSGRARVIPENPDIMVPNQNASMSPTSTLAEAAAPVAAGSEHNAQRIPRRYSHD